MNSPDTVLYLVLAALATLAYYGWVRFVHIRVIPAINSRLVKLMGVTRSADPSAGSPLPSRRAGSRGCLLSIIDFLATSLLTMLPGMFAVLVVLLVAAA